MQQDITHVALDNSKHSVVIGILGLRATEPELRPIPNEPRHLRRLFARLQLEGMAVACYEADPAGYYLYRQIVTADCKSLTCGF
jgi:hypothetical protein